MVARSTRGSRVIAVSDFFQGVMSTALAADELLVEVRLPLLPVHTRCGFYEFNRRAGDFALAMALAAFRIENGVVVDPRIGVGGVEERPRRIAEAEAALNGCAPSGGAFNATANAAANAVDPIDSQPDLAAYKRDLTRTAVKRALNAVHASS